MAAKISPALKAALSGDRALPFAMLRVDLPAVDPPLCLLSGSGELVWQGQKYLGTDERFGSLSAFDPPEDGEGDTAPMMTFEIAAVNDAAASTLAAAKYQGSRVRLYVSAIVGDVGAIAEPYCLFDGILDVPEIEIEKNSRSLNFDCVSGFELLFADTEGQRLAAASHRRLFPNEGGFDQVTGVNRSIIWGPGERPGTGAGYASNGGGFGGGGYNGGGGGRSPVNKNVNLV